MKKNNFKTFIEPNYSIFLAGAERNVGPVQLTMLPGREKSTISAAEIKRLSYIVCKDICISKDNISYIELDFLKKLFKVNQSEIANLFGIDRSTVSKWKDRNALFNNADTLLLKKYFSDRLKKNIKENNSLSKHLVGAISNYAIVHALSGVEEDSSNCLSVVDRIVLEKLVECIYSLPLAPSARFDASGYHDLIIKTVVEEDEYEDNQYNDVMDDFSGFEEFKKTGSY